MHQSSGSGGNNNSTFYDYRNAPSAISKEPIVYDFKPPDNNNQTDQGEAINPNDYFIAGVENMLLYGEMKNNQHQVMFVKQISDGISLEDELLLSSLTDMDSNENKLQYYPDVEFRFDAGDEPNDDDLANVLEMYRNLVENGGC